MTENNAAHNLYTGWPEHRRVTMVRCGHFRVDRVWFRAKRPTDRLDWECYNVAFEVDAEGEFDLGSVSGRGNFWSSDLPSSSSDLRRSALYLAWIWRRAHSPPPESRPKAVPYYRRRVWALDSDVEGTPPGEWYRDSVFTRPDRPTIDVEEAASLIEGALHELEEGGTGKGK